MIALVMGLAFAAPAQFGGRLESHLRLGLLDCPSDCPVLDFGDLAVIGLWSEVRLNPAVQLRMAVDLRMHPAPQQMDLVGRGAIGAVPLSFRLPAAYVQMKARPWLTHRVGVQAVRWGVADGFHVADPVNPKNLENPLAFDASLPVPMVNSTFYRGKTSLELVWVPIAFPSILPRSGVDVRPGAEMLLDEGVFSGVSVGQVAYRTALPSASGRGMSAAARLFYAGARFDLALSAYWGRDSLPQADGQVLLTGFQTDAGRVDLGVDLVYPRVGLLGAEARGELIAGVAGWIEAALVLPSSTSVLASAGQLQALVRLGTLDEMPDPIPEVFTQDGRAYVKWIAGLERGFGRLTLNLQWLHGLPLQRQGVDLRDYLILGSRLSMGERALWNVNGVLEREGQLIQTEYVYLAGDSVELSGGVAIGYASERSDLLPYTGLTQVYLGSKVLF